MRVYCYPLLKLWTTFLLVSPFALAFETSNLSILGPRVHLMMMTTPSDNPHETRNTNVKVLGVCGGIGSGKSIASKLLVSELGCLAHLDADSLAHSVYSPGSQAVKDIVAAFGEHILQDENKDEIDRKKLGTIVFADRNEMAKLERLVWPHVKTILMNRIEDVKSEWNEGKIQNDSAVPVVVLEAAVLLDADWDDILDGVWVVKAPREIALQRLMETRGLSQDESEKRIHAQQTRRGIGNLEEEIQNKVVTKVIENDGSLEDLRNALAEALRDPKSWK